MTTLYGGSGGSPYLKRCPSGTYLTEISGSHTNDTVTQLCGKCSDGTVLPCVGKAGSTTFAKAGPFSNINVRTGSNVDNILGHGGGGGYPHNIVCPDGTLADAYEGRSGDWINAVGFQCGYTRPPVDASGAYGGLAGVGFSNQCPVGTYLTELSGSHSDRLNQVCGKCSDGTVLPCAGKAGPTAFKESGPFTNIKLKSGDWVDNLMGHGGMGGGDRVITCPEGTYANKIFGRGGEWIDALGFQCGYTKPTSAGTNSPIADTKTPGNTAGDGNTADGNTADGNTADGNTAGGNSTAGLGSGNSNGGASNSSGLSTTVIVVIVLVALAALALGIWLFRRSSNKKNKQKEQEEYQRKQFALLRERQNSNPTPNQYPQQYQQVATQQQPQYQEPQYANQLPNSYPLAYQQMANAQP